jgi:hypothetical protein
MLESAMGHPCDGLELCGGDPWFSAGNGQGGEAVVCGDPFVQPGTDLWRFRGGNVFTGPDAVSVPIDANGLCISKDAAEES